MNINQQYNRSIRIESNPKALFPNGRSTYVYDVDTGEPIQNILRMVVYLDGGRKINRAEVTYAEMDESGKSVHNNGDLVEKIVTVDAPEIAVIAIEEKKQS